MRPEPPTRSGEYALQRVLRDGLQRLSLAPAAAQVEALLAYQALIARWNRVYNLTAVREPEEMLTQHLLDSAAIVPALQDHLARTGSVPAGAPGRLLDVGSGPGLPGVVVAVLMPELQVTCVDAVAKKASFVRQVAAELGLSNLQSVHARVQQMQEAERFDVVVSRAFASLSDFTGLTRERLVPGRGVWVAMKGRSPEEELAALRDVRVLAVQPLQVPGLDAQRCLVWMAPA